MNLKRSDALLALVCLLAVALAGWVVVRGGSGGAADAASASSVPSTSSTLPTATPSTTRSSSARLRALFIGDAYTAGAGGGGTRWSTLVAKSQGWTEINVGASSSGYQYSCGRNDCRSFVDVAKGAASTKADIVIVSGGRLDSIDGANVAAPEVFSTLHRLLPNAKLYATSPIWGSTTYPKRLRTIGSEIEAAVTSVGGTYLDLGSPLTGATSKVSADGVYPNADGYRALAAAVEAQLKSGGTTTAPSSGASSSGAPSSGASSSDGAPSGASSSDGSSSSSSPTS